MARHRSILVLAVGGICSLAHMIAMAADPSGSARSGDLHFGNALDLKGWGAQWLQTDEDGMSLLHAAMLRTPGGALYPYPPAPQLFEGGQEGGWSHSAFASLGYAGTFGDDDALWFRQYADWGDDLVAGLSLDLVQDATGNYLEFRGSRLNENSQSYRLRGGRAGAYRVEAFLRDVPHLISTTAYPIWEGVGGDTLTLPPGLTPGASTVADVAAASAAAERRTLRVDRTRAGISIESELSKQWTGYASFTNEEREGTRLWGGPMFFAFIPDNGGVNETVRPIDFTTTDIGVGARFVGSVWRFNAVYSGSFFRNHKDRLDYESPFTLGTVLGPAVPPAGPIGQGQFSLEPDNDYHNLRLELSRAIAGNGELSIAAAAGTMRQDDALLAPLNCTGTGGIFLGPVADYTFNCADWNTTAALSQQSANARIDTQLVDLHAVFRPSSMLGWQARLKHYREDNRTRYLAYNPITGEYGYISENGSQGSVVPGEAGIFDPNNPLYASYVVPVRNVPFEYAQTTADAGIDLALGRANTLSATYTFDRLEPEHRERKRVDDQRLTLAWMVRLTGGGSLRVSYEIADRSGDTYRYDPYEEFYSSSLPGFVTPAGGTTAHTVDAMRKYDLADRRQDKLRAILVHPVGSASTVSATAYGNYNDYQAPIGRRGAWTTGATLQWDFQPSAATSLGAYAGYDYTHYRLVNVADDESNLTSDASLGGATYPLQNLWSEDDREDSYSAGATLRHDFGRYTLDVAYGFVYTQGEVGYDYASLGAVAGTQQALVADIGTGFPGNYYRVHSLDIGVIASITERLSARIFGRYEIGDFADFHYAGFEDSLVYAHRVYTDQGPAREYDAGLVGLMLNYRL